MVLTRIWCSHLLRRAKTWFDKLKPDQQQSAARRGA
jgi:hypothetical protein